MGTSWFSEGDLSATLRSHGQKFVQQIASLDPQLIRFSPEAVVAQLADDVDVVPLDFQWDAISRTAPVETTIEASQFGERYTVAAKSVTLLIPFSGDPMLFKCRASTHSLSGFPFDMQISSGVVQLQVKDRELTAEKISTELQKFRTSLEQRAGWIKGDVEAWRGEIRTTIQTMVEQRRVQLEELAALDAALEIPMTPNNVGERIDIPLKPKRLSPVVKSANLNADPRIAETNYREILAIISNLGRAQERLPKTASKFTEEELRDLILFNLNANFAGAAKGEAFSGNGKTDIFLDWNGSNAFIAECKVWRGQKQFAEAIDQLLSYTVWRDSKAALILFIRSEGATEVIQKAQAALAAHPRRTLVRQSSDTDLTHYMMKSSTDEAKLVDVAFIPFVVLTPPKAGR